MNARMTQDGATRRVAGLVYSVHGQGPAALLLHPAFAHRGAFDGEVEALSDRHRLIRVDLPGHGETGRGDGVPPMDAVAGALVAILDAEGVDRAHVLGVSMGSLIGQDLARRHPERVRSLTSLGGYPVDDVEAGKAQNSALLTMIPKLLFAHGSFRRGVAQDAAWTEAGRARFEEMARGFRFLDMLAMRGMDQVLDPTREDAITCPLLIAVGEHDLDIVRDASRRWHAATDSTFVELAGAGHCANLDDPQPFQAAWLEFVGV